MRMQIKTMCSATAIFRIAITFVLLIVVLVHLQSTNAHVYKALQAAHSNHTNSNNKLYYKHHYYNNNNNHRYHDARNDDNNNYAKESPKQKEKQKQKQKQKQNEHVDFVAGKANSKPIAREFRWQDFFVQQTDDKHQTAQIHEHLNKDNNRANNKNNQVKLEGNENNKSNQAKFVKKRRARSMSGDRLEMSFGGNRMQSELNGKPSHWPHRPHKQRHYKQRYTRAVTAKAERIWDYGIIPYEVNDNLFSMEHRAMFKRAMLHWENHTCIKFIERDPQLHRNYIYFTVKSCGCCSFVGKRGNGRQAISIGRDCEKFGIVVHELGHVIGFWHEHTRSDRNEYIYINRNNIIKGLVFIFNEMSEGDVVSLGMPYDYNSIMHYAKNTFSKNSYLDTIQPIGPNRDNLNIGQRKSLSPGDIQQANLLYTCPKCGRTFQQRSGKIVGPHYYLPQVAGNASVAAPINWNDEDNLINGQQQIANEDVDERQKCEWRITATYGERIILQVHDLQLLATRNCQTDYLEIRDGYWLNSPVIKRLCGNVSEENIIAYSSRMLISYVNQNFDKGYRGFTADYEISCGGDFNLTDNQRIDSPKFPIQYEKDVECIWRITVPKNNQIVLTFRSFRLEISHQCLYDYIEVRDGFAADSKLLDTYCGYTTPSSIATKTNQMYIKFVTDGSVQKDGFSAVLQRDFDECFMGTHDCEHECINTVGGYECVCLAGFELQTNGRACKEACGGIVNASNSNGNITSPRYPNMYPTSKQCIWELVAPANHAIFLTFTDFNLEGTQYQYTECNYDYVAAFSRMLDNSMKKIGVYCGDELPPTISSEQNILRLEFFSDRSVQDSGFVAHYQTDYNECGIKNGDCEHLCHNTIGSYYCSCRNGFTLHENGHDCVETKCKFIHTINRQGLLRSPNFPKDYPRNSYCFWKLDTIIGHRITLTFIEFELEHHQECIYDYVAIHDGRSENDSTLGIYCGSSVPNTIVASSNNMFIVMRTDASLQRKGFFAVYSTECGGYLHATNETQSFVSHLGHGTRSYRKNVYCDWRIQADPDSSVRIQFVNFDLEYSERCEYDFIEITEEHLSGQTRNMYHGRFCGREQPPVITSYSDTLLFRFQTDNSSSLSGFEVIFVAVEPPEEDIIDDLDLNTPFPGSMKNIYYTDNENDYNERDNVADSNYHDHDIINENDRANFSGDKGKKSLEQNANYDSIDGNQQLENNNDNQGNNDRHKEARPDNTPDDYGTTNDNHNANDNDNYGNANKTNDKILIDGDIVSNSNDNNVNKNDYVYENDNYMKHEDLDEEDGADDADDDHDSHDDAEVQVQNEHNDKNEDLNSDSHIV